MKAVGRAARVAIAPLALTLAGPVDAAAACPPYAGHASPLERLVEQHAGRTTPLPEKELLDLLKRESIAPISVHPRSGPAPLRVRVKWLFFPVEKPVRIEFDVEGSGSAEWTERGYHGRAEHTYPKPGHYDFAVWIHEANGRVRRFSAPVEVIPRALFERELEERWSDLKTALRRGDVTGALDCIHTARRKRYEEVFRVLAGKSDVDHAMTSIRFVKESPGTAIYEMLRDDGGRTLSYEVRFAVDGDGVWRLESM